MKEIKNWRKASVCDIESDGLLDEATKIHVVGIKLFGKETITIRGDNHKRIKGMLSYHLDNEIPIVGHSFISYDVPLLEKLLGIDLSNLIVIDSLALSWYLNINKAKHGLDHFFEEYGVKKPAIEDWENLPYERYVERVEEDIKINHSMWEDFKGRLVDMYSLAKEKIDSGSVGGKRVSEDEEIYLDRLKGVSVDEHINRILTYLMFKMDCKALKEKTKWDVDLPFLKEKIAELEVLVEESANQLESVMPPVPDYRERSEPKNKFLKSTGGLSKSGEKWEVLKEGLAKGEKDEWGNPLFYVKTKGKIAELVGYKPPNINGHQQVKDFLFSHGWKPETFKIVKDKEAMNEWFNARPREGSPKWVWDNWREAKPEERAVPQVRVDGKEGKELCDSVSGLAEEIPEIKYLEEYSVVKHRLDTMKGILSRVRGGKVVATNHGFTNTLRLQHSAPCVNLPSASRKYAEGIRGSLVAPEGYVSLGTDLSSLEDRVKIMFMIPHDPEYAEEMSKEDFDPHLTTAVAMGGITVEQSLKYKSGTLTDKEKPFVSAARSDAKTVNYLSVYGGSWKALQRQSGWDEQRCKDAIDSYWEKNWSVTAIAEEQVVVTCKLGLNWLVNPINGHLYSVRSEKDRFSTLAQGTGAYLFDMWIDKILDDMYNRWGKKTLTADFHDEAVFVFRDTEKLRELFGKIIKGAIKGVSREFMLRRELDCDIQYGSRYSEIH